MKNTDKILQAKIAAIAERISANPNADGWIGLCEILKKAKTDKRVVSSVPASEFLEVMSILAEDALTSTNAIKALRQLAPAIAGDQLRDNTGRHEGGATMAQRKEEHVKILTPSVTDILKNPATSGWSDPAIARWLMEPQRALHKFKKIELSEQTMIDRVAAIREMYKTAKSPS